MNAVFLLLCVVRCVRAACDFQIDACGDCDGTLDCLDCRGIVLGTSLRDECGVCDGDGRSCAPCRFDEKDLCGVCFGDSTSCLDCQGTPNGPFEYDACGVCGGPSAAACLDCSGEPSGALVYDLCDVCGGDSTSCLDCSGVLRGSKTYDRCDVCGGTNACLDCAGVLNGLADYDVCDVCDGDNSECRDCAGALLGTKVVDACGNCVEATSLIDERGRKLECAPDILRADIDNALGFYLTLTFVLLLVVFVAMLLCLRRTRAFWFRLVKSLSSQPEAPNGVQGRRRGGAAMPKTVIFAVAVVSVLTLVGGADATRSENFYEQICRHTNINTALADPTCGVPGLNACSAWTSYNIIDCYANGEIRRVKFDLIPRLGGRIFAETLQQLVYALSISFRGRTDGATLPLSTNPDVKQLTFDDFRSFDFTGFNNLTLFRIATSRLARSGLPPSIGGATQLQQLTILDSDLGGEIIPAVCELAELRRLQLVNADLSGPAMCDVSALTKLRAINLANNKLSGPMPDLSSVAVFFVNYNNNEINGTLDASRMSPMTLSLLVRHNRITSVTQNWAPITPSVILFSVSWNAIEGTLPAFNLDDLFYYDVSHNKFDAWDPSGFPVFGRLEYFDVSHNLLPGPLPNFSDEFPLGNCFFDHNLLCELSDVPAYVIAQNCTFSLTPDVCGCAPANCVDCLGAPFGSATYDACGVCGGDGNLCRDCRGVRDGTSRLDACGVCNGDNNSCRNCAGIPDNNSKLDVCGVCNGDSSTCGDCAGTPHGPYRYDACGVCTLPESANLTCIDCRGVPHGTSRFDELGVCGGDGDFGNSRLSRAVANGVASFWKLVGLAAFVLFSVSLLAIALSALSVAARRR